MFSLLLFLLVPLVLTALAWRDGLHALAANADSTSHIRLRTWPTMFFLLGTVVMVLGLFIETFHENGFDFGEVTHCDGLDVLCRRIVVACSVC